MNVLRNTIGTQHGEAAAEPGRGDAAPAPTGRGGPVGTNRVLAVQVDHGHSLT